MSPYEFNKLNFGFVTWLSKVMPGNKVDLKHLLLPREKGVIRTLCKDYRTRFKRSAQLDENLFIHLGDNVSRKCWSATSGKIPTFRTSAGKMYNVAWRRWLTGREKMAALGFPISLQVSEAMGVPTLCMSDTRRANHVSGNSMHFASIGVVQMVALAVFAVKQ